MAANPFKSGAGGLELVWYALCVPSSSSMMFVGGNKRLVLDFLLLKAAQCNNQSEIRLVAKRVRSCIGTVHSLLH